MNVEYQLRKGTELFFFSSEISIHVSECCSTVTSIGSSNYVTLHHLEKNDIDQYYRIYPSICQSNSKKSKNQEKNNESRLLECQLFGIFKLTGPTNQLWIQDSGNRIKIEGYE